MPLLSITLLDPGLYSCINPPQGVTDVLKICSVPLRLLGEKVLWQGPLSHFGCANRGCYQVLEA